MNDSLVVPLTISGFGLLTLFAALAILYGLIYLLTAVTGGRCPVASQEQADVDARPPAKELNQKRRAAVIAVALARAERARGSPPPAGDRVAIGMSRNGEPRGAWWMLHHQRRLALKPRTRRPR